MSFLSYFELSFKLLNWNDESFDNIWFKSVGFLCELGSTLLALVLNDNLQCGEVIKSKVQFKA
jgi:hypothetical protein